jgi:hypothetical protein
MGYYEGNISDLTTGGGYNSGGFMGNGDGWWAIILFAMIFGWGRGGYGSFGGGNGGSEVLGYELGRVATTNDVASGFSTSTIMSNQRESQLAMQQGFADVQQTLCQGFNGINTSVLQLGNANERGFATTNYNMATGLNGITSTIQNCCCDLKSLLLENRYLNEKQTCDIIQGFKDVYTNDKIETLNRKLAIAEGQISQAQQSAYLLNQLKPCPSPSYLVPNPNCCYNPFVITPTTPTTPTTPAA